MVVLTVGVLIATVAFVLYTYCSGRWPASGGRQHLAGAQLEAKATGDKPPGGRPHSRRDDIKEQRVTAGTEKSSLQPATFKMESEEEDASTPKATPALNPPALPIPELSLSDSTTDKNDSAREIQPTVSKRAPPSQSPSALMPPPSVRPSALRPLPKANGSSLMPPPSAASALRVPPGRAPANGTARDARNPAAASTSTLPPASRPRKKIILPPGHSPLDWAHLTRNPPRADFLRGEGVPSRMLKVSPAQLKHYNGRKGRDAWGTYQGKVYNMTPYKDFHPGGVGELMRGAGKAGEAERLFNEIHPWVNWDGMLSECLVGVLVGEGEGEGEKGASAQMSMDEMD